MIKKSIQTLTKIVIIFLFLEFATYLAYFIVKDKGISKSFLQKKLLRSARDENNVLGLSIDEPLEIRQNVLHPYLGFVRDYELKKNPVSGSDRDYTSLFNEFGFLGDKPLQKKAEDKLIVALLGGSVAEQFYLYEKDYLIKSLKSLPYFQNKKIHILNLALGAYKQPQQLMTLNYLLALGGEFDIVINIDGFNEINTPFSLNRQNIINPFFPWEWRMWSRRQFTKDMLLQADKINNIKTNKYRLGIIFSRSPLKNSYFLLHVWNSLYLYENSVLAKAEKKLNNFLMDAQSSYQTTGPPQKFKNTDEFFTALVEVWKNSSFEMNALAKANDILYLHFLQPNQYFSDSKILTPEEKGFGIIDDTGFENIPKQTREQLLNFNSESIKKNSDVAYNLLIKSIVNKGYPLLINAAKDLKDNGVKFYDLTLVFKNETRTIFSDICCHFNQLGNQILASKIVEVIAEKYSR